ncbi:MAG: HD domain-containing protein [Chloroflexota bacterium]|nr:MAG: HD domain-containing protein [Chloroflexota bacterium]
MTGGAIMSAVTPREALTSVPLFRRLKRPHIEAVLDVAVVRKARAGVTLQQQDETGQAMFVFLSGSARGEISGQTNRRVFRQGDYVGELALLEPAPATWTIVTEEPTEVLTLTQVQMASLMRADPELAIAIAREVSRLARSAVVHTDDGDLRRMQAQMLLYAEDLKRIYDDERERSAELRDSLMDTIRILVNTLESRDPRQVGHGGRVARYAQALAMRIGWDVDRSVQAAIGGLIHDIGLVGVRDDIARKRGPMDRKEIAELRQHPEIGARLLRGINSLEPLIPYVLYHHENFDGTGYPERRRGQDIPIEARLVAVADAFDDLRASQPPGDTTATDEALQSLRLMGVDRLDPELVLGFVDAYRAGDIIV